MSKKLNQKGQALIEYLILIVLIAVVAIGTVRVVGQNITAHFASISNALNDKKGSKAAALKQVNARAYTQVRGFSDYMENTSVVNDKK